MNKKTMNIEFNNNHYGFEYEKLLPSTRSTFIISAVALGALALVALAYCATKVYRKLRHTSSGFDQLPDEMLVKILEYNSNPQVGFVCKRFRNCEHEVHKQYLKRLAPFRQTYNLPDQKEHETSHIYLRRCIVTIIREQNRILDTELPPKGLGTLEALSRIEQREMIVEDYALDQFCQAIKGRATLTYRGTGLRPVFLAPFSGEDTLSNRAAHWKQELKKKAPTVTLLALPKCGLKRLPKLIESFTNLTYLNLGENKLKNIPDSTGNLTNLTHLYLWNNNLESIPDSIGNLTNLTHLYLWNNNLESIPDSIGNLTNLTELNLWKNNLESIPEGIHKLKRLTKLSLESNKLKNIPDSIGNLTNLTKLNLSLNELKSVPEDIGKLDVLNGLYLAGNKLQRLPESIGNLTNLTELNLSWNKFISIPEPVGELKSLDKLGLRGNKLFWVNRTVDWIFGWSSQTENALRMLKNNDCEIII